VCVCVHVCACSCVCINADSARVIKQQPLLSWILICHTSSLQQLHCIPLQWCIKFNLAPLTYKVLHTIASSYLAELLNLYVPAYTVQSSSSANMNVLHSNVSFGSCWFSTAPSANWNSLPSFTHPKAWTLYIWNRMCACVYVSLFLMHGHSFERSAWNLARGILIPYRDSWELASVARARAATLRASSIRCCKWVASSVRNFETSNQQL